MNLIEKIRRKPPEYRRTFSYVVSVILTLIILAVWVVSKVYGFSSGDESKALTASATNSLSLFSNMKENVFGLGDDPNGTASDTASSDQQIVLEQVFDATSSSSTNSTNVQATSSEASSTASSTTPQKPQPTYATTTTSDYQATENGNSLVQ
jgi:hypothetical protein